MNKDIGIIVTFYNHKNYIYQCLENLRNLKLQYPQINIYVINSGSTDFSFNEYRNFTKTFQNLNIIRTENLGSSGSKNYGAELATDPIITFLDGDDLFDQKRILIGAKMIFSNEFDLVIGNQKYIFESDVDLSKIDKSKISDENPLRTYLNSMILKKDTFFKVGLFDTNYKIAGDLDWFLRAKRKKIKIAITHEDFVMRRIRVDNLSFSYQQSFKERNLILLKHHQEISKLND